VFGPLQELQSRAAERVAQLHERGVPQARLYGADDQILGGLSSFYLLVDKPEVYGLPAAPIEPDRTVLPSSWRAFVAAVWLTIASLVAFRRRGSSATQDEEQP
jgi:formate dehydrogenase iron-sulfur subunit